MNKNVKFEIDGMSHHGTFACWSTNYTETPHGIGQFPVAICISNGKSFVVPAKDLVFVLPNDEIVAKQQKGDNYET